MTILARPSSREHLRCLLGPPVSRFDCGPVAETQTGSGLVAKLFVVEVQTDTLKNVFGQMGVLAFLDEAP